MESQGSPVASLMMKKYKPRWSQSEELMLVQAVLERESRLFGPVSETGSIKKNAAGIRKEAWSEIAEILNSIFPTEKRDYESTRKKYYNFRNKARTKLELRNKPGIGPVETFSKAEALILGLNYDATNASMFENSYDDEQLDMDPELNNLLDTCTSTIPENNTPRTRRTTKRTHQMIEDDPLAYEKERLNLELEIHRETLKYKQLQLSLLQTHMIKAKLEIETLQQKRDLQITEKEILSMKLKFV